MILFRQIIILFASSIYYNRKSKLQIIVLCRPIYILRGRNKLRLVPIEYVKAGSFLAQPLYNSNGQVLLYKGASLTNRLIVKIREAGFSSIYINDKDSSKEEVIKDVIRPEIRQKAVASIKNLYETIANTKDRRVDRNNIDNTISGLKSMVNDIIDNIFNEQNTMVQLVDIKNIDSYTYSHSVNVGVLSLILGISYGLNKNDLYDLTLGALLHDLGKMFVPEDLIKKPGKLTFEEFEAVKEHSFRGYKYMKEELNINARSRIIALQHHEKIDGTGYPYGLKDKEINLFARITTIADVYDALTSDRPYKKAAPVHEAIEYIMGGCGSSFDYDLVNIFIKKIVPYPIGTIIRLSNNTIGVVEDINPDYPLRPIVKVVRENKRACSQYILDLVRENTIVIEDIVYNI